MTTLTLRERTLTTSDNLRLYVQDWGDEDWPATPVLCLHGLVRNSRDFGPLARWLADPGTERPRRVIVPDLRGRGRSARDPDWRRPDGNSIGLAFACDSADDVDAVYAELTGAGYESHKEPWDAFWGMRYAQVRDPDGHVVDLFAPL